MHKGQGISNCDPPWSLQVVCSSHKLTWQRRVVKALIQICLSADSAACFAYVFR